MMTAPRHHVCMTSSTDTITLRLSAPADVPALTRLARLDSRRLRDGRYLLAEHGDRPMAAMALRDGSVLADPFQFTASAIELLRSRREQLLIAEHQPRLRHRRPQLRHASRAA